MNSAPPTISIITVCLNAERYIRDTLESVRGQSRRPHEFIVIDGGSTDRTNAIVEEYRDVVTEHVSEPDRGIADAMNKGIRLSTGDYLMFLHSDDYLLESRVLENVRDLSDQNFDIHAFNVVFRTSEKDHLYKPRGFGTWANLKTPFLHQGTLCHRRMFESIGGFDQSLSVAMDYDFFLRAYRSGHTAQRHDFPIAVMRDTGISSRRDWAGLSVRFAEERRVHEKNADSAWLKMFYAMYWPLYLPYRRARYRLQAGHG
jgi:glycosyltransferase involved in cell wall biosynthesis